MAFVAPTRGDLRPCSRSGCAGTMRLGRASDNAVGREHEGLVKILSTSACPDPLGWVCDANAEHFRLSDSHLLTLVPRAS